MSVSVKKIIKLKTDLHDRLNYTQLYLKTFLFKKKEIV